MRKKLPPSSHYHVKPFSAWPEKAEYPAIQWVPAPAKCGSFGFQSSKRGCKQR